MAGHTSSDKREKPTTHLTIPTGSHSNIKEKSKALQTRKSRANSAPQNQIINKYLILLSRQENTEKVYKIEPKTRK